MTALKICGITQAEDGLICASLGVSFLGLNFCPQSPRYLNTQQAGVILTTVKNQFPTVQFVGIFQNEKASKLLKICEETGIDLIQLHGDETKAYQQEIQQQSHQKIIKAIRLKDPSSLDDLNDLEADYILLDSFHPVHYGGTGIKLDLHLASRFFENVDKKRLILAGGIKPQNVLEFVKFEPFAIDISSGVEKSVGIKDPTMVKSVLSLMNGEIE